MMFTRFGKFLIGFFYADTLLLDELGEYTVLPTA
jgi:hypothetical protein